MNLKTFNNKEFFFYSVPAMLVDLAIHIGIFEWLLKVFTFTDPQDLVLTRPRSLYFLIVGFIIAMVLVPIRFYSRGQNWKNVIVRAFFQCLVTVGILAASVRVLFYSFAGQFFLLEGIATVVLISLSHLLFRAFILMARKRGRNKIHVVVVGENENAERLSALFRNDREYADYKLVANFGEDLPAIEEYLDNNKVHQLYCSLNPALKSDTVNTIIRVCEKLFIEFYFVPNMDGYPHRSMTFSEIGPMTVVKLREEPLSYPLNAAVKRAFDIIISILFLITIYPFVWCFVAIGTSISSPGPILFKQKRTGYKGRPFTMYKFRSMKVNADADKLQATADDPRKTKFGDFLRRTSIDELPQFINVLKGDMSIIGPRPHMELHTEIYTKLVDEYLVRHMVKPGLTGWAQVNGCRGETKTTDAMADRVRYDIWYIEHWSVGLDIKIFIMTIAQILGGDKQAY
ncbi:MAG: exopolysaccharide biosynthesis polyprenyl glycosylphosphotransferase [Bacteroidales bacterium]|nr:exopolysaccharide biosynthesis polyprenyl glycosylphosphotransferase [Bacteroidales bacterium]